MSTLAEEANGVPPAQRTSAPPAKRRLAQALRRLLRDKDFHSITTAEISRTAEANEALIYRYFKDKRGLLHQVLGDYLLAFHDRMQQDLNQHQGAIEKLKVLIRTQIGMYDSDRVFAKILLLEVRNFPGYFESDTYRLVKIYGRIITDIVSAGIDGGEIRADLPPARIRDSILGGIEHACMAPVIFGRDIDVEATASQLSKLIFRGIEKPER